MKLEIATIKASEIHEKYLTIQKLLNAAIGIEFAVSNEEKLCRKETKLLSIVGTRIKAKFANTERKKATLLLPQMDLPFSNHTTYGITDFTSNWKQTFGEQITSSLGKIADGIFTTCPLDRFFHCASFRLSTFGVSFQGDTETNTIPANKKILQPENSNKPKPLKNEDDDNTKSAKLHRMIKAQMKIPEGLIKPRRERLYHFNARFDSPFLFFIVDEKWASILMAGLYAGTPAMTTEAMTRSATPKQLNSRNKKKPISSALIKAKKPKKKCLVC
uniref:Uncharacterized protein n=1 Tax=Panagrolaimus superbus TaxID=310955 RepID=A0A914Y5G9_9BILA